MYLRQKTPFVLHNVTNHWPAFSRWTDEYLGREYGHLSVTMEGKREDQGVDKVKATIGTYFKSLQSKKYIVSELPQPMYKDVGVPYCLRCGAQHDFMAEVDLWVSEGGTSSVLHKDPYNQMNCLVKGSKVWTLIDPVHIRKIPMAWEDGLDPQFNTGEEARWSFS